VSEPVVPKPKVFLSYSHKDEVWKDRLLGHLQVAAREDGFDLWDDRRIQAGADWRAEILREIGEAGVAVLLISTDFLNSNFIREEEVWRFLERRATDGLKVFPVIVRECLWKKVPWLAQLQLRPVGGKPLATLKAGARESKLVEIAGEISDALETAPPPVRLSRKDQFLAAFRRRLAPEYSHWDLGTVGVTQSGGASRPIETDLDVMYLPLRLAEGFELSKTDRGDLLPPETLLSRPEPLVIRGPAGSGKTTWMRWTFRQLLRMDSALPLMLVLRDLASRWQDRACQGAARSLDAFLENWIAEHMGPDWEGVLPELLATEAGPRPVLLVDGWDELGPLGDEMRSKLLGFLGQYPRVLAVVTSRPYGEGRPSYAERFEVLDIQPLSDAEVADFTVRFFIHCHGGEQTAVQRNTEHFQGALARAPEAQALARTALLLTMMLLISRSRPLPDKRHLLYEACIENLLTALPNRKEQEGALLGREQWRPDDSEERMRVVAALAAGLQEGHYKTRWRSSTIVQSWQDMASHLPEGWSEKQKMGFLAWLAGPAGLLNDRVDGTLTFTHLSFQEYLTAWRLNAQVEGAEERAATFQRLANHEIWWETLRLWAALVEKQSRERLDAVLASLIASGEGAMMLAGAVFADGLGTEERFRHWADRLSRTLGAAWQDGSDLCAQAWASSRQDERKEELARRLANAAPTQTWLGVLRYTEFAQGASLRWRLPALVRIPDRILIDQLGGAPATSAADVAIGRLLATGSPIWPADPLATGLLQAWPGERRLAGLRLQLASVSGCTQADLSRLAAVVLKQKIDDSEARDLARDLAHYLARDLARYLARDLARYLAHDFARDLARYLARYLARDGARDWTRDWAHYSARDRARDWARYWARDVARHWARDWAQKLGINSQEPWAQDFASVDLLSLGRGGARVSLASARRDKESSEVSLLSKACQLSLYPKQDGKDFERALTRLTPKLDPLWPALARHLARRSTPEDRALLTDLARHPEKSEPPLSWGLQFIVRGDVMLEDGSVVTLDELADEAGLPHLPYLEEMPDELEVDWDEPRVVGPSDGPFT
jgi:hypothetical protein